MSRVSLGVALCGWLLLAGVGLAQEAATPLLAASGRVEKVERDTLTVQPRGETGRFEKGLALHVTGTSRVSLAAPQRRDGRTVMVQREIKLRDLQPRQAIAVVYSEGPSGPVLLTAVALPAAER